MTIRVIVPTKNNVWNKKTVVSRPGTKRLVRRGSSDMTRDVTDRINRHDVKWKRVYDWVDWKNDPFSLTL